MERNTIEKSIRAKMIWKLGITKKETWKTHNMKDTLRKSKRGENNSGKQENTKRISCGKSHMERQRYAKRTYIKTNACETGHRAKINLKKET